VIGLENIALQLGPRLLFTDVNLQINVGERYAIVGANGAGKSTILRLIAGDEDPSSGVINIAKNKTIGWLQQDQHKYNDFSLIDTVLQGKPELWDAVNEKEELLTEPEFTEAIGVKLSKLEEIIQNHDGYSAESLACKLLKGLGFLEHQHTKKMSALSGGYKIRVLLAKLLFSKPDILLLDEPTNHLDIVTTSWLENYLLESRQGILLFVSHDRTFCNNVASRVLDIDYGEVREYKGNLDLFDKEKVQVIEQKKQIKANLETKIAHLQSFVDRFGAKASKAKQAKSRAKAIDKIELPDIENSSRRYPRVVFAPRKPSGRQVLNIKKISKAYGDKKILNSMNFMVHKGDKVAITGANGIGKSTLLKIVVGEQEQDSGGYDWGYGTEVSYFPQEAKELLKGNFDVLTWLEDNTKGFNETQLRSTLGRLLFDQDDVKKNINILSGGECSRLVVAKLMLEKSNVLVLDEPTNHLDMEAIVALADAIKAYEGTVIFVSHDRTFIDRCGAIVKAIDQK